MIEWKCGKLENSGYDEEGIHFLSPEEKEIYEEIMIRREAAARLEQAAIKSGNAIRMRVKKRRYAWDRLPNKTKWP
ncbi:MAG: hypothetical protein F4X32_07185 [Candidatus Dadabacteria bacterium]|nr:hypothetical protein [Candidatus Dadabacteria bacterium]